MEEIKYQSAKGGLADGINTPREALIRISGKFGLTSLFYVKNGADSRKGSLIYFTSGKTKLPLWPKFAKIRYFCASGLVLSKLKVRMV